MKTLITSGYSYCGFERAHQEPVFPQTRRSITGLSIFTWSEQRETGGLSSKMEQAEQSPEKQITVGFNNRPSPCLNTDMTSEPSEQIFAFGVKEQPTSINYSRCRLEESGLGTRHVHTNTGTGTWNSVRSRNGAFFSVRNSSFKKSILLTLAFSQSFILFRSLSTPPK